MHGVSRYLHSIIGYLSKKRLRMVSLSVESVNDRMETAYDPRTTP